jgi:hypothetical protein
MLPPPTMERVSAICYVKFWMGVSSTIQIYASHAALSPLRLACVYDFGICEKESQDDDDGFLLE